MEKPYTFAQRLKTLMEEKHLTKSDLARICDINKSNMTRYCNGEYEAKQDVVYKLSAALNVSVAWLMGYDVPMEDAGFHEFYSQKEKPAESDGLSDKQKEFINLVSQLTDEEISMLSAQIKGLLLGR